VPGPRDAFAARVVLAAAAEKSLDVQYYIFHGDQSGWLLLEALWDAAERGVRVEMEKAPESRLVFYRNVRQ
jgi:putative cardiolipin synthase